MRDSGYEIARTLLVAELHRIGQEDRRNGFTAMANKVHSGEAVSIPSWVAMDVIARGFRDDEIQNRSFGDM